ncbi:protein CDV3 homolog isoform 4-T4 [Eudromia elegans]
MAETEERSLDDFFAKRDKKKRKEKSSRVAAAANAAAASSGAAASAAAGGARPADGGSSGGAASSAGSAKAKDDWKEFEQKEEIDYSGLRVQSMQISEKDDDDDVNEKREEPGDNWEEAGGGADKSSGPWNKSAPAPAPVVETIVTEAPEPVQTGGVYRPPGAREGRPRRAQQGPPEIYSDTQFPSLQSTAKLVDSRKY